jgi:urea transport system permease protein
VKDGAAVDAFNGAKAEMPAEREDITVNNRLRREIESALAALKLISPDRAVRLAAARRLPTRPIPGCCRWYPRRWKKNPTRTSNPCSN